MRKRRWIWFLAIPAVLFMLMLLLPWLFRGKIAERILVEINRHVEARVEVGRVGVSLFRMFPEVSVSVRDIRVIGEHGFSGDTLADLRRLDIAFNLPALFKGPPYRVSRLVFHQPGIKLKVLENGDANWNIFKFSTEGDETPVQEAGSFSLALQSLKIIDGRFVYHDDDFLTYIDAGEINGTLTGDLTLSSTSLATKEARIGWFNLRYDSWPLLSRARVLLTAEMDADLDNMVFVFRNNELLVNELPLVFEGMVGWPADALEMDFGFASSKSGFESFLSLIPALYFREFDDIEASGSMKLQGYVRGSMEDGNMPGFGIQALVENGGFRYPGLPASAENIWLKADIINPGGDMDATLIDLAEFRAELAGMPVQARLKLRNPVSDPDVDLLLMGLIDLGRIKEFYPLPDQYELHGLLQSDLEFRGRLSDVEQGRYNLVHAEGSFLASGVRLQLPESEDVLSLNHASVSLNPRNVVLESLAMSYAGSDVNASGSIENLPGFLLANQSVRGAFVMRSDNLDLNRFMEALPASEKKEDDALMAVPSDESARELPDSAGAIESQVTAIRVPENIDFSLDARIGNLRYGSMTITQAEGVVRLQEGVARFENMKMQLLGGQMVLGGTYDPREENPSIDFSLSVNGIDIKQSAQSLAFVRFVAPVAAYAAGRISLNLRFTGLFNNRLLPIAETLSGGGGLRSADVAIAGVPVMQALADQLQMDVFRETRLQNIMLSFVFQDGRVRVPPVDFAIGPIGASLTGDIYFNRQLDYTLRLQIPRSLMGTAATRTVDELVSRAAATGIRIEPSEEILVDVAVGGFFHRPRLSLSMAETRQRLQNQLEDEARRLAEQAALRLSQEAARARDRAEDEARAAVEQTREALQGELDKRASQLMEEAHRQAELVKNQAARAAGVIRREAREQAAALEEQARPSGAIALAAARRSGEALVREADRRATQMEEEADRSARRLVSEAQLRADKLRQGEPE